MISSLLDTVRLIVAIDHQPWLVRQTRLHDAGTINPITKACAGPYRRFTVPGSHGSTATVWSKNKATELLIECSAPRFLTGQNVFGTEDLKATVFRIVRAVCEYLGIRPTAEEKRAVIQGRVRLARVDVTTHLKFEEDADVEHFLKAMKLQLAFGCHFFSAYGNETLYINQHSDTRTLKLYNKGRQILKYPLNRNLPNVGFIEDACDGLLRVELTLRRPYFKRRGITQVCDWDANAARQLLIDEVVGLHLRNVKLKKYAHQDGLKNQANALLAAHMAGSDVETILLSARALRDHARAIVEATGINVYVPFVAQIASSKIDLESFADRLQFGPDARAAALGVTAALTRNSTAGTTAETRTLPTSA